MILQTGGLASGATSTRSRSASAATRRASSMRTMPTCSPPGPIKRTSGTRMRSLTRVSVLMGPPMLSSRSPTHQRKGPAQSRAQSRPGQASDACDRTAVPIWSAVGVGLHLLSLAYAGTVAHASLAGLTSSPLADARGFQPAHYLCGRRAELRFTVRRPASAEVSPCCHRPSGGDIASCLHVGIARPRIAGFTLENRLTLAVFRRDVPAHRASLRRVRGRDLLDPTACLVLQARGEQTPSASADATVQPAFLGNANTRLLNRSACRAGHRTHVKGLDADRVEALGDIRGDLFDPVLASVSLTRFQLCDRQLGASSPEGAALGAGETLLQHLKPPGLTTAQDRHVQQFAGRQCRRHRNTAVDTQHAPITGTGDRIRDVGERDMPAAGPIAGDPVGLDPFWHRARQPE